MDRFVAQGVNINLILNLNQWFENPIKTFGAVLGTTVEPLEMMMGGWNSSSNQGNHRRL